MQKFTFWRIYIYIYDTNFFAVHLKRSFHMHLISNLLGLHAIVMRISLVNLHQLFSNEAAFNPRAVDRGQATQFARIIADESHAIVNVRLRSLIYAEFLRNLTLITKPSSLTRCSLL